jgi:hypothetical protein
MARADRLAQGTSCALRKPYPSPSGATHVVLEPLDYMYRMYGMPRAQGCAGAAMARLAALVPRPRLNLTRFHGVFAHNFKHRAQIVPRRARGRVDADKPLAPMTWPLSHIPVLRGTGTSCPMGAAPQARVRHAPGHPLLMLRINSPCRRRGLSSLRRHAAGHCLHAPRLHSGTSWPTAKPYPRSRLHAPRLAPFACINLCPETGWVSSHWGESQIRCGPLSWTRRPDETPLPDPNPGSGARWLSLSE